MTPAGLRPDREERTAFLFDLDGTLVDSVYQHVLAWNRALQSEGVPLSVWRIHRKIGMSGGLWTNALLRELGRDVTPELLTGLRAVHTETFGGLVDSIVPLPGAVELLAALEELHTPWAIATSGRMDVAGPLVRKLGVDPAAAAVITRDDVQRAKPDPDLFIAAAERLGFAVTDCVVVGDSIWDLLAARRAGALGVGLRSGGYGDEELVRAGAYRVYDDPADLLRHLDEVGVRRPSGE